ncbi:MAG: transglycosylase SLT domain-containing protein, partial [Pseudonocardiaceae bacterium]
HRQHPECAPTYPRDATRIGAHRLPRPNPATRGRALTAAVAAGALAVAGHSLQANASGSEQVSNATRMTLTEPSTASNLAPTVVPELMQASPATSGAVDLQALGRAVERADRAAERAAAQAAYEEAMRNRLGKPYRAGNNHSLDGWIAKALGLMGLPQALAPGVKKIVMHESTGNPDAINNYDRNALNGTPSQGLMQTIPSTFNACVLPSLAGRSITDPVANITAGVRSMITHHGVSALMNGGRRDDDGNYLGYGGAGCSSYDISQYADDLNDLWEDEPLPQADDTDTGSDSSDSDTDSSD